MTAEKMATMRMRLVSPTGDGRVVVFAPTFAHPFWGFEIVAVVQA